MHYLYFYHSLIELNISFNKKQVKPIRNRLLGVVKYFFKDHNTNTGKYKNNTYSQNENKADYYDSIAIFIYPN